MAERSGEYDAPMPVARFYPGMDSEDVFAAQCPKCGCEKWLARAWANHDAGEIRIWLVCDRCDAPREVPELAELVLEQLGWLDDD